MGFEITVWGFVVDPRGCQTKGRGTDKRLAPEIKFFDSEFRVLDLDFAIYAWCPADTVVESKTLELGLCCG